MDSLSVPVSVEEDLGVLVFQLGNGLPALIRGRCFSHKVEAITEQSVSIVANFRKCAMCDSDMPSSLSFESFDEDDRAKLASLPAACNDHYKHRSQSHKLNIQHLADIIGNRCTEPGCTKDRTPVLMATPTVASASASTS